MGSMSLCCSESSISHLHPIVVALLLLGSFISACFVAGSSAALELSLVLLATTGFVRFLRDLRRSDHAPFWDAGIPAILVTDTSNFRSPFYHTAMDRIEMIDFEFAAKVVLATAASIQRLASKSVTWGAKVPLSSRSQPRSTNSALQSTSPLSLPSSG